jgi:hypothetical protein
VHAVIQLDRTGCAIASAAALGGISYRQARRVAASLGITVENEQLWSDTEPIKRLLQHLGVRIAVAKRPFRSWNHLPPVALLAIKWHLEKRRPHWHWVVFVRDRRGSRVLDPKKSLRHHARTDFGRMKPKWFIAVDPSRPRSTGRNDGSRT